MMPAGDDRRARPAAGDPAEFADLADALVRVAVAGSFGNVKRRTESTVRTLARHIRDAARREKMTPASVADWLEHESWMAEPADVTDVLAASRVIRLLRSPGKE